MSRLELDEREPINLRNKSTIFVLLLGYLSLVYGRILTLSCLEQQYRLTPPPSHYVYNYCSHLLHFNRFHSSPTTQKC